MKEIERIEKAIINYLEDSLSGEIYTKRDKNLTNQQMIGHGIAYFLMKILRDRKDSTIKNKWLDDVEWENFELFPPNMLKGSGRLWWGLRHDYSAKTYSENIYCELNLVNSQISYLFLFQIEGKQFNLKN